MKKWCFHSIIFCFLISIAGPLRSQNPEENMPLMEGLFHPGEIDMHVHAGKERQLPLDNWIDLFIKDGRKVLLLLDHLELYRMTVTEHSAWLNKNKVQNWYPDSSAARHEFVNDLRKSEKRQDIIIFNGWEIWEGELDEGLEKEPMRDAEVIGWHISKAAWDGKSPGGMELIIRAKQIIEIQKEFPVPMILFHPFAGRIKSVRDAAIKAGRQPAGITSDEYRYFTADEQNELIKILAGRSVYIEIEREWSRLWDDPVVRKAFIEDIRPLAEAGLKFTVSSDAHGIESFNTPFTPEKFCSDLGITTQNLNAIIRELLEIRAKKSLSMKDLHSSRNEECPLLSTPNV